MPAYHNDPALRRKVLAGLRRHAKRDAIWQGTYGEEHDGVWRGCSIACLFRSAEYQRGRDTYGGHDRLARILGIPEQILFAADTIFESLPAEAARQWALDWPKAIRAGVDLSLVWPRFVVALLAHSGANPQDKVSWGGIEHVEPLYQRWIDTGTAPPAVKWDSAANSVSGFAAYAVVMSAPRPWVASQVVSTYGWHVDWQVETLLKLLREAPKVES